MIGRESVPASVTPSVIEALPPASVGTATVNRRALAALAAHWPRFGLATVLLLSAALNLIGLNQEGYANTYYAAAVKSMLTGWRNFFFVAFDAGGFVSVDKPPLGLWLQAASAKLFGFNGVSLLLPQALAGIAAVALLYWLVRRAWGPVAGLAAALALAVTPISVVANRNNTSDSVLVLALLGAAWAVSVAAERGSVRLLLLGGVLVGLAFNVKMLEAYLILPALGLVYLLGAPRSWRARLGHLALLGLATLVVSFAWVAAVDLTPASARPYVGSSGTNSALSLVLGYNGLTRLTLALPAGLREALRFLPGAVDLDVAPAFAPQIGDPGLLRLFNDGLAGQASWLLALAVAGLLAAVLVALGRLPLDRQAQAVVLWGGWLSGAGGFFSVARFYHLYYLTLLGPVIAALTGIGLAALWRLWRRGGWWRTPLPLALAGAALMQARLLAPYPLWSGRLSRPVVIVCLAAAVTLALVHLLPHLARVAAPLLAATALLALLVAPLVWSVVSVQGGNGAAWLPEAGPANTTGFRPGGPNFGGRGTQGGFGFPQGTFPQSGGRGQAAGGNQGRLAGGRQGGFGGGGQALTIAGANWDTLDPQLVQYLLANQGDARYLVATPTSTYASVFMLATDQPALALGGYQGWDRILTPTQLAGLVRAGAVRFFYLNGNTGRGFGAGGIAGATESQDATTDLTAWVQASCAAVPASAWQGTSGTATGGFGQGQQQLYDCASVP
jgi:4-amino-4-deoxy-L-arabinose transferase-like glycosyltransferase